MLNYPENNVAVKKLLRVFIIETLALFLYYLYLSDLPDIGRSYQSNCRVTRTELSSIFSIMLQCFNVLKLKIF